MNVEKNLPEVIAAYDFPGTFIEIKRHGNGHINDTFVAIYEQEAKTVRYLVQRINTYVFRKPEEVMTNIVGITSLMRRKITERGGDPDRETLNIIPTRQGKTHMYDADGNCWRVYVYIEDTVTLERAENPQQFYEAAKVFGRFQGMLAEYPVEKMYDTIPDFHNTRARLDRFDLVLKEDAAGRVAECGPEIDFILQRRADMCRLCDMAGTPELPIRVVHNDTKLNNVLMDRATEKGLCVTDLDTVMPGLSLYDYGDAIRFGANPADEDERDLSKVYMDETLFEAYTKGYLEEAGSALTQQEKELLPLGARVISLELGLRFLSDYIEGDPYFKIHRPGQNLDRARTQLAMAADMERKWDRMNEIVRKYI